MEIVRSPSLHSVNRVRRRSRKGSFANDFSDKYSLDPYRPTRSQLVWGVWILHIRRKIRFIKTAVKLLDIVKSVYEYLVLNPYFRGFEDYHRPPSLDSQRTEAQQHIPTQALQDIEDSRKTGSVVEIIKTVCKHDLLNSKYSRSILKITKAEELASTPAPLTPPLPAISVTEKFTPTTPPPAKTHPCASCKNIHPPPSPVIIDVSSPSSTTTSLSNPSTLTDTMSGLPSRFAPGLQTSNLPAVREGDTSTGSPTRDAAKLNMLRRMRPPPFKYAWTFYHDKHADSADYTARLTVLLENIISLKPFWESFNRFPLEQLRMKDSVHFFKRGVKPVWEDPRNVRGGSWTFRVPKDKSEQFWKEALLLAVGEQFADVLEPKDDLCGLSLSTRFNSNLITIWNRDGENKKAIDGILEVVLGGISEDIRPRENSYYYKKHSEHQGFEEAVKKAREEKLVEAQAAPEGKIEEAKVTDVEVAKHEKEEAEEEAGQQAGAAQ